MGALRWLGGFALEASEALEIDLGGIPPSLGVCPPDSMMRKAISAARAAADASSESGLMPSCGVASGPRHDMDDALRVADLRLS